MVDAAATTSFARRGLAGAQERGRTTPSVARKIDLQAYAELCRAAAHAPAQSPAWVGAWAAETHADLLLVALFQNGEAVLSLALEIVRKGPFRIARFPGGRHANGNFPAVRPAFAAKAGKAEIRALMQAVRAARPDIDLVHLERMLPDLEGMPNPLLAMPHAPSPNLALSVDLAGGFEVVLDRCGGKRKRKKHRSQMRKFEASGGHRLVAARSPEDVDRLWAAFLSMKEQRFRKSGIHNVFAEPGVQAFFRRLFKEALGKARPPFALDALEVGGELRAVTGSSRGGNRVTCEFGAIREDELAFASPGDFLFHESIREACEDGLAVYDFGVGDEPYKRAWCDVETRHFDVAVPVTAKGRALELALRAAARAKARVKASPLIWALLKRGRRRLAGEASAG